MQPYDPFAGIYPCYMGWGLGAGVDLRIFSILIILIVTRQPKGVMGFMSWLANRSRVAKGGNE
ncbi:hypothetical protein [Acetomicrobium mobile]|uniref:hypothetical protein n=1 Tax=Acetomicrobium mobile TaxID=97477 RepID=UPI0026F0D7A5|nr:hypothetical protein [Acetomicrobium mobile]